MKAMLRQVQHGELRYSCLMFCCPGCAEMHSNVGLHMLPVNTEAKKPAWTWDGNVEAPTITPSILTQSVDAEGKPTICHSYLKAGRFEFLGDCTHSLAGQSADMLDLPEWVIHE